MSELGEQLIQSLQEAIEIAKGKMDKSKYQVYTPTPSGKDKKKLMTTSSTPLKKSLGKSPQATACGDCGQKKT